MGEYLLKGRLGGNIMTAYSGGQMVDNLIILDASLYPFPEFGFTHNIRNL
jgi:hypothetical protein